MAKKINPDVTIEEKVSEMESSAEQKLDQAIPDLTSSEASAQTETEVPEQNPEVPEQNPEAPEQNPEVPEQNPEVPEQNPEVPEQNPEVPEQNPEAPEQNPEAPEQNPEVPEQKPEVPEQKPEVPEQKPEVPEQNPEAPEQNQEDSEELQTELSDVQIQFIEDLKIHLEKCEWFQSSVIGRHFNNKNIKMETVRLFYKEFIHQGVSDKAESDLFNFLKENIQMFI